MSGTKNWLAHPSANFNRAGGQKVRNVASIFNLSRTLKHTGFEMDQHI